MKKDNKNQELNQNEKNSYLKKFFIILFALTLFCAGVVIIFYTINTKCDISVNDCKNIILNKINFLDNKNSKTKEFISYYKLGEDFEEKQDFDNALRFYKKAEAIYSQDYIIALKIADVYRKKHDFKKLVNYALKSLEFNNSDKESIIAKNEIAEEDKFEAKLGALYNAAQGYRNLHECKTALNYYTKVINSKEDSYSYNRAYLNRGKCYLEIGNKENALNDFKEYKEIVVVELKSDSQKYSEKDIKEVDKLIKSIMDSK